MLESNIITAKYIISIIFKVINFALLVWIFKYFYKNSFLPGIKEKLAAKFAFFKGLEDKNKDLIIQDEILQKEIKDQDKLFELLKEKIETWNKKVKEQKESSFLDAQKISSYHKKRIETQTQNMHNQKLIGEIFPRVIAGTYQQLEQKFRQEQEAEKFFRNIIDYMKNNTHKPTIGSDKAGLQK